MRAVVEAEVKQPAARAQEPAPRAARNLLANTPVRVSLASLLLLIPCFWQKHIEAVDLPSHLGEDRFRALIELEIERAKRLYAEGLRLIPFMTGARGRAAFQFAADAYGAILDKIRQNGHDVITRRASLSLTEKLAIIPVSTWHAWRVGTVRTGDAPAGAGRGP